MTVVAKGKASSEPPDPASGEMPVLPVQSDEDTDAAWGEHPRQEDDERLHRDRPPHWDSI
jgi:hypothetical protein